MTFSFKKKMHHLIEELHTFLYNITYYLNMDEHVLGKTKVGV